MNTRTLMLQIEPIVRRLMPLVSAELRGHPPELQGAVLADLTATWLAGFGVEGDAQATARLREDLLGLHLETIRRLIPVNEALIAAGLAAPGSRAH